MKPLLTQNNSIIWKNSVSMFCALVAIYCLIYIVVQFKALFWKKKISVYCIWCIVPLKIKIL